MAFLIHGCVEKDICMYIQQRTYLYTQKLILFSWFSFSNQVQFFSIIASPRREDFIFFKQQNVERGKGRKRNEVKKCQMFGGNIHLSSL